METTILYWSEFAEMEDLQFHSANTRILESL